MALAECSAGAVHVDKPGLGRRGADIILERIADPRLPPRQLRLPAGLCVRGTTAPCLG